MWFMYLQKGRVAQKAAILNDTQTVCKRSLGSSGRKVM